MGEQIKIENTSKELFEEIIKTIPIIPNYVDIKMLAEGIQKPSFLAEEDKISTYLSECAQHNIVPFSFAKFEYYEKMGFHAGTSLSSPVIGFPEKASEKIKKASVEGLLKGGRIHKLEVRIARDLESGFKKFQQEFLDTLLNRGYQLFNGEFWLIAEWRKERANLWFDTERLGKGTALLYLEGEYHLEEENKLRNWFTQLAQKYQTE